MCTHTFFSTRYKHHYMCTMIESKKISSVSLFWLVFNYKSTTKRIIYMCTMIELIHTRTLPRWLTHNIPRFARIRETRPSKILSKANHAFMHNKQKVITHMFCPRHIHPRDPTNMESKPSNQPCISNHINPHGLTGCHTPKNYKWYIKEERKYQQENTTLIHTLIHQTS